MAKEPAKREPGWSTVQEIAHALGRKRATVQKMLQDETAAGTVERRRVLIQVNGSLRHAHVYRRPPAAR